MLSREQQATQEFMKASEHLRQVADDRHGTGLLEFTDALVQAIACFGTSELYARQAERGSALDVHASRVMFSSKMSARCNEKGIKTLSYAREALKHFRKDLSSFPIDTKLNDSDINIAQQEIREALADLEIKESDVIKIDKVFTVGFELVRSQGVSSLPEYLESQISNLERIRRQPDRGAIENIPVWKLAAIAIAVGVWIWALFRCKWWGSCSSKEGLAYATVFWISALIARFC